MVDPSSPALAQARTIVERYFLDPSRRDRRMSLEAERLVLDIAHAITINSREPIPDPFPPEWALEEARRLKLKPWEIVPVALVLAAIRRAIREPS